MKFLVICFWMFCNLSWSQMESTGAIKFGFADSIYSNYNGEKFMISITNQLNDVQLVDTFTVNSEHHKIDAYKIPSGLYTIKLSSSEFTTIEIINVEVLLSRITFLEINFETKSGNKNVIIQEYVKPKRYKNCG